MKAKVEREYQAFNLRRKEQPLMEEQRELAELRQIELSQEDLKQISCKVLCVLYSHDY